MKTPLHQPPRPHNTAFGNVLADLRRKRGLSQEKLGFEADFDRTFISLLERGRRSPTLDTVFTLCRTLDVPFVDLATMVALELEKIDEC